MGKKNRSRKHQATEEGEPTSSGHTLEQNDESVPLEEIEERSPLSTGTCEPSSNIYGQPEAAQALVSPATSSVAPPAPMNSFDSVGAAGLVPEDIASSRSSDTNDGYLDELEDEEKEEEQGGMSSDRVAESACLPPQHHHHRSGFAEAVHILLFRFAVALLIGVSHLFKSTPSAAVDRAQKVVNGIESFVGACRIHKDIYEPYCPTGLRRRVAWVVEELREFGQEVLAEARRMTE